MTIARRPPEPDGVMSPESVRAALRGLATADEGGPSPDGEGGAGNRHAAVALLLRWTAGAPEVLLMTRAARQDDLWSGQVSLPGGHVEASDPDLRAAAVRETREELGFDIEQVARHLGTLPAVRAGARRRLLPLWVHAVVFECHTEPALVPGQEAADAFWFPLAPAAAGVLDGEHQWIEGAQHWSYPCWRWEGRVVWGLTHRVLCALLAL